MYKFKKHAFTSWATLHSDSEHLRYNANLVHIVQLCVCCANKELCLGYK